MPDIAKNARKNPRNKRKHKIPGAIFLSAAAVFLADTAIKTYLRKNFAFHDIPVIKNLFHINTIFNTGAAFGILRGQTQFLTFIGIIFIIFFPFFIKNEEKKTTIFLISCGMIIGGAISNLCDRILLGYVVDYIDLRVWPVFNLSDSCISVGTILILIDSFRQDDGLKK